MGMTDKGAFEMKVMGHHNLEQDDFLL